ncbi:hypothetical protein [Nonomuraea sp. LPB2021202275-12-8]|uniref:hypothetical protein n=1 Tax=Nonomuraea sp. LPB2021202275-12-8 TaxID=3120159 RepID=UPI00300C144D
MDHSNHTTLLQAGGQTAISDRMRELLARAAQDHVYEQRTQGAVLDEIRQRLEGMEWLLREVRERELGGLSGTLETVSGRLDDIAAKPPMWAEGLAQHVEAVRDHVDAVGEQIGDVDSRVESVNQRVHPVLELPKLRADLGTVCEGVEETLSRLQSVLDVTDGMTKRMGDFTTKLAQVSAGMEVAAGRFNRIDKSLAELNARTDRVEGVVLDLSDGFDERLAATAQQLTTSIDQVNVKVDAVEQRLGGRLDDTEKSLTSRLDDSEQRLAGRVHDLTGRFDGVDSRADRIDGRLVAIDSRLASVDSRFETAGESLTGIGARLEDLDGRVGVVDSRLNGFDTRLTTVDGRLTTVHGELSGHDGRFDTLDEHLVAADRRLTEAAARDDDRFNDLDTNLKSLDERLVAAEEHLITRVDGLDAHLTGLTTRSEQAGETLESVGRHLSRLPETLAIDERLGELLESHQADQVERLSSAAAALTEIVSSRPDREELAETVSGIVEPATADLNKRLGALEETMLALAEALLRPTRGKE